MSEVLVVGMVCTPITKVVRSEAMNFSSISPFLKPQDLALQGLDALFFQTKLPRDAVEVFKMGCDVALKHESMKQAPDREIAIRAGMVNASSNIVRKACSSGFLAVKAGADAIKNGDAEIAVISGLDMMSGVPDAICREMLTDPISGKTMAELNDIKCREFFTREDCDQYALKSHRRAWEHRLDYGTYMAPILIPGNQKLPTLVYDEDLREKMTIEKMRRWKLIDSCELTTGANASGYGDGFACMMLTNPETAKKYGLRPLAEFLAYAEKSGGEPKNFIARPVEAAKEVLKKASLAFEAIDSWWIHEAFAGPPLIFMKETGAPWWIVNPWGGAIAFRHPLGESGMGISVRGIAQCLKEGKKFLGVSLCNAIDSATAGIFKIL